MRILGGLCVAGLLLASGCVKLEQDLIINSNGGGTIEINYSVPESTTQQVDAMRRLKSDMDAAAGRPSSFVPGTDFSRLLFNPVLDELRAKLKEYEKNGIAVEKLEVKFKEGRQTVGIRLQFDDLARVARTDFFQLYGFSLTKDPKGNYVIERPPQVAEFPAGFRAADPQTAKALKPFIDGFLVALSVRVPDQNKILSTSAAIRGPYTAGWRFDAERSPDAVMALLRQNFVVVFDGRNLELPEFRLPERHASIPALPTASAPAAPVAP
jgi:hypothetical protein